MDSILQSESSECGLASLAMVASAHGLHIGLPELRRRFSLSLKGAKLNHLIRIAQSLGFSARALRLDMEDFGKLALPCVLHWDLNHFVVLARVGKGKVTILDPAIGERRLSLREVSEHFTGVALELTPTVEFKPQKAAESISVRQLTGRVVGLWPALVQIGLLSVALQVFVVLAPFFLQWTVDQVLVSADKDLLTVLGLGFGLALLLQVGIGLLRGWSVTYRRAAEDFDVGAQGPCDQAQAGQAVQSRDQADQQSRHDAQRIGGGGFPAPMPLLQSGHSVPLPNPARGQPSHRRLPGNLRSDHQWSHRSGQPGRTAVREDLRGRGAEPGQGPDAAAGAARGSGPEGAGTACQRRRARLRHPAGRFRACP